MPEKYRVASLSAHEPSLVNWTGGCEPKAIDQSEFRSIDAAVSENAPPLRLAELFFENTTTYDR